MPDKDFNRVLEKYLTEGYMDCEEYEAMNEIQVIIIQAIKRARKRIKAKQNV